MSDVKKELVELYNSIGDTDYKAEDISFRVDGIFTTVTDMDDEQAAKTIEGLKKQIEDNKKQQEENEKEDKSEEE